MKLMKIVLALVALLIVATLGFVYAGVFNVAADDPHWGLTQRMLEATRDHSIVSLARDVEAPPKLDDPALIAAGAQEYAEMCTGCHLAPGMEDTEMRTGLYPKPPKLSEPGARRKPAETFWVIKHGLKMTGMPAWGLTHDDQRIWSMTAFVQKLPELSQVQYEALIEQGGGAGHTHGEEMSGHSHGEASMPHEEEPNEGEQNHGVNHEHGDVNEKAESGVKPSTHEQGESHTHTHSAGSTHVHTEAVPTVKANGALPAGAAEPVAIVERFLKALSNNDTKAAGALLDPRVLIYESGNVERSRQEYAAHHLGADAEFLKSAQHHLMSRTGDAVGDLAWVATESRLTAQGPKPSDAVSTETMVLRKTVQGWRIVHIHWSSRPAAT